MKSKKHNINLQCKFYFFIFEKKTLINVSLLILLKNKIEHNIFNTFKLNTEQ